MVTESKICKKCGESKSLDLFYWDRTKGRRRSRCIDCESHTGGVYRIRQQERIDLLNRGLLMCTYCGCIKTLDNYYIVKTRHGRYMSQCKSCLTGKAREYRKRDDVVIRSQEYERSTHRKRKKREAGQKPERIQYVKDYGQQHKDKQVEGVGRHRKTDRYKITLKNYLSREDVRLVRLLRSRINNGLKSQGVKKDLKCLDLLGCTLEQFRKHIENQFQDGMTWENRGLRGWHIDHIMPVSSFNLENIEEQNKCFHFSNLRPLWATDNLSKGAKILAA